MKLALCGGGRPGPGGSWQRWPWCQQNVRHSQEVSKCAPLASPISVQTKLAPLWGKPSLLEEHTLGPFCPQHLPPAASFFPTR